MDKGFEFKILAPHPRLSKMIKYYWLLKDKGRSLARPELMLPDGHTEIIFNRINKRYKRRELSKESFNTFPDQSYIIANNGNSVFAERIDQIDMVGIKLTSYGLYQIVNIPIHEFSVTPISLNDLGDIDITMLDAMLMEVETFEEVKRMLDSFFMRRLSGFENNYFLVACNEVQKCRGLINIRSIAKNMNISYSTLERSFRKYSGMSPKSFQQLTRFRYCYSTFNQNPNEFLAERKYLDWQYFDQSHFIKDFNSYLASPPTKITSGNNDYSIELSHIHLKMN